MKAEVPVYVSSAKGATALLLSQKGMIRRERRSSSVSRLSGAWIDRVMALAFAYGGSEQVARTAG